MLLRTACLTLVALLALTSGGSTQESSSDSTFRAATNGLTTGTQLRVVSTAGDTIYAKLLGVGVLGLRWEDETHGAGGTPITEIRELRARRRAWRKGMLIGGALGAVAGVFGGLLANEACESGQGCSGDAGGRYAISGAFLLGAVGGIGGALVGSAFREWHVVYRAGARARR